MTDTKHTKQQLVVAQFTALCGKLGRTPTNHEVSAACPHVSEHMVQETLRGVRSQLSTAPVAQVAMAQAAVAGAVAVPETGMYAYDELSPAAQDRAVAQVRSHRNDIGSDFVEQDATRHVEYECLEVLNGYGFDGKERRYDRGYEGNALEADQDAYDNVVVRLNASATVSNLRNANTNDLSIVVPDMPALPAGEDPDCVEVYFGDAAKKASYSTDKTHVIWHDGYDEDISEDRDQARDAYQAALEQWREALDDTMSKQMAESYESMTGDEALAEELSVRCGTDDEHYLFAADGTLL